MDAQEVLKPLLDKALAKDVVAEAVERFCGEFDELEALLEMVDVEAAAGGERDDEKERKKEDDSAVSSIRALYPRTGAEVRALLS